MPPSVARKRFYSLEIFHILKSTCLPTLVKFCVIIYKGYNYPLYVYRLHRGMCQNLFYLLGQQQQNKSKSLSLQNETKDVSWSRIVELEVIKSAEFVDGLI